MSTERAARLFALCRHAGTASRAADRVLALAKSKADRRERTTLLHLSDALHEHRHALLCQLRGDARGMRSHTAYRDRLVAWAVAS